MSEAHSTELVLAHSGQLVNLDDLTQVASAYEEVSRIKQALTEADRLLRESFAHHARMNGTKTLYVDGVGKFEVKGSERTEYPDPLSLAEALLAAGMPQEVVNEIVVETVSYKVDARRAARAAAANPEYAEIIERWRVVQERTPTISITL
jgi:hypothetical protein